MSADDLLTTKTSALQTPSGDVTMLTLLNVNCARRVYCNTSGALAIKRASDTAFVVYTVVQGAYIDGKITAVGGSGNGTTCNWIAEA